jgi:hypothetical protein
VPAVLDGKTHSINTADGSVDKASQCCWKVPLREAGRAILDPQAFTRNKFVK